MFETRIRNGRATAVVIGLAIAASVAIAPPPASPKARAAGYQPTLTRFDTRLLADMNRARAAHGLRPLVVAAGTTDVAHAWSCHLAQVRALSHNGSIARQLESHGSRLWTSYAENVGWVRRHAGADRLFRAYMNSPEHRANILDPSLRFVGLWSKRGGHHRYNTVVFVGARSSAYDAAYGAARQTC